MQPDSSLARRYGDMLQRTIYHYWYHTGENMAPTQHPKIVRYVCDPLPLAQVKAHLEQLTAGLHEALRERSFWLLTATFTLYSFSAAALWAHIMPARRHGARVRTR